MVLPNGAESWIKQNPTLICLICLRNVKSFVFRAGHKVPHCQTWGCHALPLQSQVSVSDRFVRVCAQKGCSFSRCGNVFVPLRRLFGLQSCVFFSAIFLASAGFFLSWTDFFLPPRIFPTVSRMQFFCCQGVFLLLQGVFFSPALNFSRCEATFFAGFSRCGFFFRPTPLGFRQVVQHVQLVFPAAETVFSAPRRFFPAAKHFFSFRCFFPRELVFLFFARCCVHGKSLFVVVFVGSCPFRFLLCMSAGWRDANLAGDLRVAFCFVVFVSCSGFMICHAA